METARHKSSYEQFCTIQIKVTANTPQILDMIKAWAADRWYMWLEGDIFVKYYSQIPSRFSLVNFDTYNLS